MTEIEEDKIPLETKESLSPLNTPDEATATPDQVSQLLKRFDDMEAKYLALSTPKPKVKKPPTEKQIQALANARIKKMENVAIRKDIASKKKKEAKQLIKEEVMEVRNKNDTVIKEQNVTVEEPTNPIHNQTKPADSNEPVTNNTKPVSYRKEEFDPYSNIVNPPNRNNYVRKATFSSFI